jgi:hypothetical protein
MGMSVYSEDVKVKEVAPEVVTPEPVKVEPVTKSEIMDALVSSGNYALASRLELAGIV